MIYIEATNNTTLYSDRCLDIKCADYYVYPIYTPACIYYNVDIKINKFQSIKNMKVSCS